MAIRVQSGDCLIIKAGTQCSMSDEVGRDLVPCNQVIDQVTGRAVFHGGNGYAMEYPVSRVLCDARILNIFEGAAEIQAQVIARRLLDGSN